MYQAERGAHFDRKYGHCECQRDPEAPTHVDQFRVRPLIQRDLFGLERHAADRTASGTDLPDLGMHRTGVDRACRRRGLSLSRLEEFFRLNLEAFAASCAAEENFPLAIFEA